MTSRGATSQRTKTVLDSFRLDGRVAVITGGGGFLGVAHGEAIAESGGLPVLWDIDRSRALAAADQIQERCECDAIADDVDITDADAVRVATERLVAEYGRIDILINNAANDPKADETLTAADSRLERFTLAAWQKDLAVGLTGAFLCSQIIGRAMAQRLGGVILNVASDLALIAPDQRLYRKAGVPPEQQPVKPVTYSVVKHGLIGLTRYMATYWADAGVRVNAISPGGVYREQPEEFVRRLSQLIPLGRMARRDEYKAAVLFLVSDASTYMTGANVVIDGGRTCW